MGCGIVGNEGGGPARKMPSTVLVADDEKNIVQLARLYLTNEGYRVEEANDGKQALDKARALSPDIILLDIMMPEMDGLTVCKELRKTSNVPVIILTARGDDIDRIVGLEIGADDYMAKPFNPRELVARVKAVLRRAFPDLTYAVEEEMAERDLVWTRFSAKGTFKGPFLGATPTDSRDAALQFVRSLRPNTEIAPLPLTSSTPSASPSKALAI